MSLLGGVRHAKRGWRPNVHPAPSTTSYGDHEWRAGTDMEGYGRSPFLVHVTTFIQLHMLYTVDWSDDCVIHLDGHEGKWSWRI